MSEYVPDTEEVLTGWVDAMFDGADSADSRSETGFDPNIREAQFYRWLNAERAKAWDDCVDAHAQVLESGRSIDVLYTSRMNPYRGGQP